MDQLHEQFYAVQDRIQKREDASPVLLLYDCTSTYFEGQCAEDGRYGYSRDKRWDRYQIVLGLVCSTEGVPLALEIWPGDTPPTQKFFLSVAPRVPGNSGRMTLELLVDWD